MLHEKKYTSEQKKKNVVILFYLCFWGINSGEERNLCDSYGNHKVKSYLNLLSF